MFALFSKLRIDLGIISNLCFIVGALLLNSRTALAANRKPELSTGSVYCANSFKAVKPNKDGTPSKEQYDKDIPAGYYNFQRDSEGQSYWKFYYNNKRLITFTGNVCSCKTNLALCNSWNTDKPVAAPKQVKSVVPPAAPVNKSNNKSAANPSPKPQTKPVVQNKAAPPANKINPDLKSGLQTVANVSKVANPPNACQPQAGIACPNPPASLICCDLSNPKSKLTASSVDQIYYSSINGNQSNGCPPFNFSAVKPRIQKMMYGSSEQAGSNAFDREIEFWTYYWNEKFSDYPPPLDPNAVKVLIDSESSFRPNDLSKASCQDAGLMQLINQSRDILKTTSGGSEAKPKKYYVDMTINDMCDTSKNALQKNLSQVPEGPYKEKIRALGNHGIAAGIRFIFHKRAESYSSFKNEFPCVFTNYASCSAEDKIWAQKKLQMSFKGYGTNSKWNIPDVKTLNKQLENWGGSYSKCTSGGRYTVKQCEALHRLNILNNSWKKLAH